MTSILIAEDQTMMRSAVAALLDLEDDFEIVGGVDRGDQVVAVVRALGPDVLLLDIEMPGRNGLDVIADAIAASPQTMVIVVTTFGRPGYLRRAMDAGARAFLVKDNPVEHLAAVIRRVLAGEIVVDPSLAAQALTAGSNVLTEREGYVLAASEGGVPIAQLATVLHLSPSTVRNYLSSAIGKTGGRNRAEALRIAREHGWV